MAYGSMKRHCTNKQLARLLSGDDGQTRSAAMSHLGLCAECRERHEKMRSILANRPAPPDMPGPGLKIRVMNSYDEIYSREMGASVLKKLYGMTHAYRKPAAVFSVLVAAVGIAFSIGIIQPVSYSAPFTVRMLRGDVTVNDATVAENDTIAPGGALRLGPKSCLELRHSNIFMLRLSGDCVFSIDKARRSITDAYVFSFRLDRGTLVSRFTHGGYTVRYDYTTPRARISATGTDFLLGVEPDKTTLMMREGSVRVMPVSGDAVDAVAGTVYTVSTGIMSRPIDERDIRGYNAVMGLENGIAPSTGPSRAVLPGVPRAAFREGPPSDNAGDTVSNDNGQGPEARQRKDDRQRERSGIRENIREQRELQRDIRGRERGRYK